MKKRLLISLFSAAFVLAFGHVFQAQASATVTSYTPGCGSFHVTGTTNEDSVIIAIQNLDLGTLLVRQLKSTPDGTFDLTVPFVSQPKGATLRYDVFGVIGPNLWDHESFFEVITSCITPISHGSPGIPAGFILKSIICDTPVYNTPAGTAVGDAHVDTGQTFFVNPIPVSSTDGQSWTEIYVSSTTNPYIPTICTQ